MNSNNPADTQALILAPSQVVVTTEGDTEEVKRRFLELMELALMGMAETGQAGDMITALGPLFLMGLGQTKAPTVQGLLTCLSEIVKGVLDLGLSPQQYSAAVEPHIRELIELFKDM